MHRHQQAIFDLIRQLSGQRAVIVIPRLFVSICGSYPSAAMLSQLLYWHDEQRREGWIYKSHKDWAHELELTEEQVRYARTKLLEQEFVQCKTKRINNSPITLYRPHDEKIVEAVQKHLGKFTGDLGIITGAAGNIPKSSIPQDYTQDSAIFSDEERDEARDVWREVLRGLGQTHD